MPSPFPGMNPWLENLQGWQGVHARLISRSSDFLQPQLRELGYYIDIDERIYIEESDRHVLPDLAIIEPMEHVANPSAQHAAIMEASDPILIGSSTDSEIKERYLQIFTTADRRLVTQIEFISLTNKGSKKGRELYIQKRRELVNATANIVEIDLLREGLPIVDLDRRALQSVKPWDYLVNVIRQNQFEHEVYPIQLRHALPRIRIPLRDTSPDVVLDLQYVLNQVYDSGPYPMRLNYNSPPVPPLAAADDAWAGELLRGAGLRNSTTAID